MLSSLGQVLQGAADLVAPPCSSVADLEFHWRQVVQSCDKQKKEEKLVVIEETHGPKHMKEILKILSADCAENSESKVLSSCLEFLVQQDILNCLCQYADSDKPLGIRQYAIVFFTEIMQLIPKEHLNQMKIHRPIQVLVRMFSNTRASPYENQEINLITVLCDKIKRSASLVLLYIEPEVLTDTPYSLATDAPSDQQRKESSSLSKFPLVDAILNLCHSSDSQINEKAHECLLTMLDLKMETVSKVMSKFTLLPQYVASRLIVSTESIPLDAEESIIETIATRYRLGNNASSSLDVPDPESYIEELHEEMVGQTEIEQLFTWVIFSDELLKHCDAILKAEVCSCVRDLFLDGFLASLFGNSEQEEVAGLFTTIITNIILISSKTLSDCIISWLLQPRKENEENDLKILLIERCRLPSMHLQLQSLRLVQTILEAGNGYAIDSLILDYLCHRGYVDTTSTEQNQTSWSDEEDERYKIRESNRFSFKQEEDAAAISETTSRTLAPANITKVINRFLGLVGDDIRSTTNEDFSAYQANALRQYRQVCKRVNGENWPREAIIGDSFSETSSTASKESQAECEVTYFEEGPLLRLLLDFLQNLPDQDYDVNLQVTSLISSLALLPHPFLHEFLLNPYLNLSPGARTPFTILGKVISEMTPQITSTCDYKNYLKLTRFQLLGTMHDLEFERNEDNAKFEALVVIEEFIKELASIAYAKYVCEMGDNK